MAPKKGSRKKETSEAAQSLLRHPRDTLALVGQQEAETDFLRVWESGRVPHAWLVTGPKGIGKATFAYRLARFLLAERKDGATLDVAMELPAVQRVQSRSHTDLLVLENAEGGEINIEEAREVNEFLALTPAEGAWRVVIIDSIDAVNWRAANALLKIIEEPPARTIIFLISHNPGTLLPTIRSRCRVLKLKPLSNDNFARLVQEQAVGVDEETLAAYHILSGGSPGVASFLLEQEALALYHAFLDLFSSGKAAPEWHKAHALSDQLAGRQETARFEVAQYVLQYLFCQLIRVAGGQPVEEELLDGEAQVLSHIATFHSVDEWLALWADASALLHDVKRIYLDRKQVLINIISALQPGGKIVN